MMKRLLIISLSILLGCCNKRSDIDQVQRVKLGMPKSKVIQLIGYPSLVKDLGEEDVSGKEVELAIYDKLATIVYDHNLVIEIVIKKNN